MGASTRYDRTKKIETDFPYSFEQVTYGSALYHQMVIVRDEQLRAPLGWHFTPEELAEDEYDMHLAALNEDGGVVATVILRKLTDDAVRLRQVAVAKRVQGQGVGSALLKFAESFARTHGFKETLLYARIVAMPFYARLGYVETEGFHETRGVLHQAMVKIL